MSQENVEAVRRAFEIAQEGMRRGDHGAAFDEAVREGVLASDVDWRGGERGGAGVAGLEDVVGRDGYVEFLRRWTEDFNHLVMEAERFIDVDDEPVILISRWSGTGRGSGAPVEMRTGAVYWVRAGRIVRVIPSVDPNHTLKAVGLSE